jgi:hypothetical protein
MKLIRYMLIFLASYKPLSSDAQIFGVVNSYFKVTDVVPSYNGLRVSDISGLNVNDRVLIIQMKGAVINEAEGATFGNINSVNGAGLYEFATICGFLNDTVIFEREIKNTYDYTKAVQLVKVPVYSSVTVNGTLRAQDWNTTVETGGVIAIAATGTITLNANISGDSAGYKGGALQSFSNCSFITVADNYAYNPSSVISSNDNGTYKGEGINNTISLKEGGKGKQSNGGGGGNNHNSGGGGGANYGSGGNGGRYTGSGTFPCNGTNVGIGGAALSPYGYTSSNNKIFMGGGGGAGHDNNGLGTPGGKGGGIVFIECAELVGNGYTISSNGSKGINISNVVPNEARGDGGGGGGAGGTIIMNVAAYIGNVTLSASGAEGSRAGFQLQCPGPGGGGGGGVIWANGILPGNVTTSIVGGNAGFINDAAENPSCELTSQLATAGASGAVFTDFNITYEPVFNCLGVLPSPNIISWSGRKLTQSVSLKWEVVNGERIKEILLERKNNIGTYTTISNYIQPQNGSYNYTDVEVVFPSVYRLAVVSYNGDEEYSRRLFFDEKNGNELRVYPNPANEQLQIQMPYEKGNVSIIIHDYTGRIVLTRNHIAASAQQVIVLPLQQLPAGVYFVSCYTNGQVWKTKFVKQ